MALRFATPAPEAYHYPLTIRHLLDGIVDRAGDQQIIYRDRHVQSYRQTVERIGQLADLLSGQGVEPGMTVAVMDWDSHRYLEAYFAVPRMGAVLQTVNVRMTPQQIAYTLDHAQAEFLIVHRDFWPLVDAILPSLPRGKSVVAILAGEMEALPPWAAGASEPLLAAASSDFPFVDFDENALATTFYTTGTTGNPKGVCFSHRQLVLHTIGSAGWLGASSAAPGMGVGDVYMPLTPMFHVHAWGLPYVATMLGLKQVYPGRYDPGMICALREAHRVTYSHCVPTVLKMAIDHGRTIGTDLSGWKMTIGGSALTKALCAEARSVGMIVGTGYGMSETCPFIAKAVQRFPGQHESEEAVLEALTITGTAGPLVDMRIVDDAMNSLPHDGETRGELVLRAPWLTLCYTNDVAGSRALWRGGWLHTLDIATIDAKGNLRIRDRLKDVIKTGGEWIDSVQLEELVATAECVAEASVVAIPDARWGERPLAVVVPKPGATPTLAAINAPVDQAIAAGAISRYAKIERFEIVNQLPRTSVGKIDKKVLRTSFS